MSNIISSPGVQINEIDLSLNARQTSGLTVAVIGYANEGPIQDPTYISSISELDNIFGAPTNAAERYMHHTARQVLTRSAAQVLAVRLPYDNASAVETRTVLVYPLSTNNISEYWGTNMTPSFLDILGDDTDTPVKNLLESSTNAQILPPVSVLLTENQYESEILQKTFDWEHTIHIPRYGTTGGRISVYPETSLATLDGGFVDKTYTAVASAKEVVVQVGTTLTGVTSDSSGTTLAVGQFVKTLNLKTSDDIDVSGPKFGDFNTGNSTGTWFRVKAIDNTANPKTVTLYYDGDARVPATGKITLKQKGNARLVQPDFPVGFIVVDENQSAQTNLNEGLYIGVTDNSDINTGDYDSLRTVQAVNGVLDSTDGVRGISITSSTVLTSSPVTIDWGIEDNGDAVGAPWTPANASKNYNFYTTWAQVAASKLDFKMVSRVAGSNSLINVTNSISEIAEKFPVGQYIGGPEYNDSVLFSLFRLKKSTLSLSPDVLSNVFLGGAFGSFYLNRKQGSASGGGHVSAFIEDTVASTNLSIIVQVNPGFSATGWFSTTSQAGTEGNIPDRSIRVHDDAKNLYSLGTYVEVDRTNQKLIGNLPSKLTKALGFIEDPLTYDIDVIVDGGLSTIWPVAVNNYRTQYSESVNNEGDANLNTFKAVASFVDEQGFDSTYFAAISSKNPVYTGSTALENAKSYMVDPYKGIQAIFTSFVNDNRKDCIYIADPLRHVFVKGRDYKVESSKTYNFNAEVFWPLYHLFDQTRSSYVATYANWGKVVDSSTSKSVWIPMSGVVAGTMMASQEATYPWSAAAGFTRGAINGLVDVALSPSQRNRDLLYKISMNPIANFANEGVVIFGQKTMFTKPSAFDRINVRRLFITLEKYVNQTVKYFVFEPNTSLTRSRLVSTLQPLFERAKITEGLYDYRIVCDERNNTAAVIDNNELKVDIYVKPTRTAEFVLVNFFATRTNQNFDEIIPL